MATATSAKGGFRAFFNNLPVVHQLRQSVGLQRGMLIAGLVITGIFVLTAIFAPLLAPYGFAQLGDADGNFGAQRPPDSEHLLGTTVGGYDVLSRVIWGSRTALAVIVVAVLPGIALGLLTAGIFLRLVRTNVIGTLSMDYVDAARSRGVSEFRLVRRHAYKPALIPIITVIGLQIALLLGGAVLTETTFEWKGLGFKLAEYLSARDFIAVQGIVALLAVIVALSNFVVDILAAVIDPRVRY